MTRIIAALDNSPATEPTIETALALADLLHANVQAVHVVEDHQETVDASARTHGLAVERLHGDASDEIVTALAEPDVLAGVLGARTLTGGRRPAGHTTLDVLQRSQTPVVVVPPDYHQPGPWPGHAVIVPLDGTDTAAHALQAATKLFADAGLAIEILHVFNPDTVPRFWDKPHYEPESWGEEFLRRHCPTPARITLRTGDAAASILDLCDQTHARLITLGWSQDLSPGRAQTVTSVLSHTTVPVLLVPAEPDMSTR